MLIKQKTKLWWYITTDYIQQDLSKNDQMWTGPNEKMIQNGNINLNQKTTWTFIQLNKYSCVKRKLLLVGNNITIKYHIKHT